MFGKILTAFDNGLNYAQHIGTQLGDSATIEITSWLAIILVMGLVFIVIGQAFTDRLVLLGIAQ